MSTPSRAKTKHFVLQHLGIEPTCVSGRHKAGLQVKGLSTRAVTPADHVVDDSVQSFPVAEPHAIWLGVAVPKRFAKRAVTRSLIKRKMYLAVESQQGSKPLQFGLWVLRLRAEFDRSIFKSATSVALSREIDAELCLLFDLSASNRSSQSGMWP